MKIKEAKFVKSGTKPVHFPDNSLPEIAFAGRSNVGKSSLLNTILDRKKLVKVSGKPGHTRLLNWFSVNDQLLLCDLPGYGFARVPPSEREAWGRMINTYLSERDNLLALAILFDVRRGLEEDDRQLLDACAEFHLQPILVGTKCDKLKPNALQTAKHRIAREAGMDAKRDIIWFSSLSGEGREALWRRIEGLLPIQRSEEG